MVTQSVLLLRKIAELEWEFEIPTWNSNWDFLNQEFAVVFVRLSIDFILHNIIPKIEIKK